MLTPRIHFLEKPEVKVPLGTADTVPSYRQSRKYAISATVLSATSGPARVGSSIEHKAG